MKRREIGVKQMELPEHPRKPCTECSPLQEEPQEDGNQLMCISSQTEFLNLILGSISVFLLSVSASSDCFRSLKAGIWLLPDETPLLCELVPVRKNEWGPQG